MMGPKPKYHKYQASWTIARKTITGYFVKEFLGLSKVEFVFGILLCSIFTSYNYPIKNCQY